MPDISNPKRLATHHNLPYAFEESVAFLQTALNYGNTIVHCLQGQNRSPTVFLAWLIAQKHQTKDAINILAQGYADRGFSSWKQRYLKHRDPWVEYLKEWEKNCAVRVNEWKKANTASLSKWNEVLGRHNPKDRLATPGTTDASKKRKRDE